MRYVEVPDGIALTYYSTLYIDMYTNISRASVEVLDVLPEGANSAMTINIDENRKITFTKDAIPVEQKFNIILNTEGTDVEGYDWA